MDYRARIRLTVDVPFAAPLDGDSPEEIEAERVAAAVHAETELVDRLKNALAGHGDVVEVLIEEVREA